MRWVTGSCARPQRSEEEWALRRGWGGRPVRQEQAQGMLVAALGLLAAHYGYGEAKRASLRMLATLDDRFRSDKNSRSEDGAEGGQR